MKFNIEKSSEYQHRPIMHINEHKTAFVCYSQFDMGAKYKVYSIKEEYKMPNYEIAFTNFYEAMKYCDKFF